MAGIGFVLRRLAQQDVLSANLRGYAHAALVTSGPWLFTVWTLGAVELFGHALVSRDVLTRFSIVIIYNFAFSLVVSGPVVLVVTRSLADRIYMKDVREAPGMFLGALALLYALMAAIGIPFYGFVVAMSPVERLVALISFFVTGGIWLAATFMSALKSYSTITAAFAAGLVVGFAMVIQLAPAFGVSGMIAGFTAGMAVIFFTLVARIFAEYPHEVAHPFGFLRDFRRYWELALVGFFYNAAIWIDKWIMWFADGHVVVAGAMPAHPVYDGAMFLAYLSIVPAMTLFLVAVETRFFETYLIFYRDIENDATLEKIRSNHRAMLSVLIEGFRNIAVLQTVVCYLAVLVAPRLVGMAGGGNEMVPVFRFGVLGALFHALLLLVMVIISYLDLRRVLLAVTVVFFTLNTGLTGVTVLMGPEYYGYGYFLSALLTLGFSYLMVSRRVARLPYMTFIANNAGLR